jgi:hypothetical protein
MLSVHELARVLRSFNILSEALRYPEQITKDDLRNLSALVEREKIQLIKSYKQKEEKPVNVYNP